MLWKCTVCGIVLEGEEAPAVCPKCGSPKEKFVALDEEATGKVYNSDRTNDIHMDIINLAAAIIDLCAEGVELDLDPDCVSTFEKASNEAWVIKQRCKAELASHMGKGKW
ncbi:rubredoxin-like domain-containing protein [Anaerotalea alkaliphila]|uniref:Rubredoxin n=1 Tax=Anaerotalea alkaliphila TaxID=2662126 RepID=A0A7X5HWN9_9FIRM|nr:rubredoxin [Anaerotalea alkaliphila]NDL67986.1 rubredoxin [Anaerotalea alkaliphila]